MSGGSEDRIPVQELYTQVEQSVHELEKEILALEAAYFQMTPVYDRILSRLDMLRQNLVKGSAPRLAERIVRLRTVVSRLQESRGYDIFTFQNIFILIRRIMAKAPEEIVEPKFLSVLRSQIRREVERVYQPKLHKAADSLRYLMIRCGRMHYLIPYKEILWQARLRSTRSVTLDIRSLDDRVLFVALPGLGETDSDSDHKQTAVLLACEDGRRGLLADASEGTLYLTPKLLQKKIDYLKITPERYDAFLRIRGHRYFIRRLE